jgi:hypothetical protein
MGAILPTAAKPPLIQGFTADKKFTARGSLYEKGTYTVENTYSA